MSETKDGAVKKVEYLDPGQWPIYVGFTTNEAAFAKEMKRLKVGAVEFLCSSIANATTHFLHKEGKELLAIITLGDYAGRSAAQIAAIIAHEATHVAQWLFESIGEKEVGNETQAYFIQYVTQHCLSQLEGFAKEL